MTLSLQPLTHHLIHVKGKDIIAYVAHYNFQIILDFYVFTSSVKVGKVRKRYLDKKDKGSRITIYFFGKFLETGVVPGITPESPRAASET